MIKLFSFVKYKNLKLLFKTKNYNLEAIYQFVYNILLIYNLNYQLFPYFLL
jgi:hypothetical protein